MSKIMIALGGNALGNSPREQLDLVGDAARPIVDLIEQGHEIVIAHGNGPQVGMIHKAIEIASSQNPTIPTVPMAECVAMSQGYIGFHLQNAIREELQARNIQKSVVSLVTQVVVDKGDQAFQNPTKPIGVFYTKEEADRLESEGLKLVEDSGRGYRVVIPSPVPVKVVEAEAVKDLLKKGHVVITVGGGGIPVVEEGMTLKGVQAVIDKDSASEKIAEELDLDYLFILTAVERVAVNYGKPDQKDLEYISVEEAKMWIEEGQFPPGSMLPKVQSAIRFVESKPGRKAVISSLEKAKEAILGKTGTTFYKNSSSPSLHF
ncbi:carbamate kinase [Bacillus sp. FJAT-18017]|uniref:carbamate kinase n=1 Tax=Bacillus sp. FJAT-18017 TaxID=1705566 RepID=UPI0006AFE08A|nr:carbamate kinase [Bacillus sp. FJAT-18017]ALC89230.1 carbamate kinase [Bacillus sp. FJAT-18017]